MNPIEIILGVIIGSTAPVIFAAAIARLFLSATAIRKDETNASL